jgi:hypothetical protein
MSELNDIFSLKKEIEFQIDNGAISERSNAAFVDNITYDTTNNVLEVSFNSAIDFVYNKRYKL